MQLQRQASGFEAGPSTPIANVVGVADTLADKEIAARLDSLETQLDHVVDSLSPRQLRDSLSPRSPRSPREAARFSPRPESSSPRPVDTRIRATASLDAEDEKSMM